MGAALGVLLSEQESQWNWSVCAAGLPTAPQDLLSLLEEGQAAVATPLGAQEVCAVFSDCF